MDRRSQNRRATQASIFDAAVRLFDAQGYEGTSVEEVCEAAGVGRATFFRHFETKSGLLREFNRRVTDLARQRVQELASADFEGRLEAVRDVVHEAWITAGPGLRQLGAEAPAMPKPAERIFPEFLALVIEIVRDARAAGHLRPDLPPLLMAYFVVMHLTGAVSWWIEYPDDDLRALLDGSLEQCLRGILPVEGVTAATAAGAGRSAVVGRD
jgi:AcrR family transcriptional regulator